MPKEGITETISVEEFIDLITDNRGEEIKEALRKITKKQKGAKP